MNDKFGECKQTLSPPVCPVCFRTSTPTQFPSCLVYDALEDCFVQGDFLGPRGPLVLPSVGPFVPFVPR